MPSAEVAFYRDGVRVDTIITCMWGHADFFSPIPGRYTAKVISIPEGLQIPVPNIIVDFGVHDGTGLTFVTYFLHLHPVSEEDVNLEPGFTPVSQDPLVVLINGEELATDASPQIINGRTMIPLRAISESLGADVGWDGATRTISIYTEDGRGCYMVVDNENVTLVDTAGNMEITQLSTPPTVIDGRTLVPLRFISEFFGYEVGWHPGTPQSFVTIGEHPLNFIPPVTIPEAPITIDVHQFEGSIEVLACGTITHGGNVIHP